MTAFEYTYDPYYAPRQQRFADGGAVPQWWIFGLLLVSLAVGALTSRRPRVGGLLTAGALFVCGVSAIFVGDGH